MAERWKRAGHYAGMYLGDPDIDYVLLGTPERDKRHLQFDTGHIPPLQDTIREVLHSLDRYLGPVNTVR